MLKNSNTQPRRRSKQRQRQPVKPQSPCIGATCSSEDAYEDWAATRREQLRELYHRLLRKLSQIYESQGDKQQSIEPLRKIGGHRPGQRTSASRLDATIRAGPVAGIRPCASTSNVLSHCAKNWTRNLEPETIELHRQIESGTLPRARSPAIAPGAIESIAILPLLNTGGDPGDGISQRRTHGKHHQQPLAIAGLCG